MLLHIYKKINGLHYGWYFSSGTNYLVVFIPNCIIPSPVNLLKGDDISSFG